MYLAEFLRYNLDNDKRVHLSYCLHCFRHNLTRFAFLHQNTWLLYIHTDARRRPMGWASSRNSPGPLPTWSSALGSVQPWQPTEHCKTAKWMPSFFVVLPEQRNRHWSLLALSDKAICQICYLSCLSWPLRSANFQNPIRSLEITLGESTCIIF